MKRLLIAFTIIAYGATFPATLSATPLATEADPQQATSTDYNRIKENLLSGMRITILQANKSKDLMSTDYSLHMDSLAETVINAKVSERERIFLWNTLLSQALIKPTFRYNSNTGRTTIDLHSPTSLFNENFADYEKKLLKHIGVSVAFGALAGTVAVTGGMIDKVLFAGRGPRIPGVSGLLTLILFCHDLYLRRREIHFRNIYRVKAKEIFFITAAVCATSGILISLWEYARPGIYHLDICSEIQKAFFIFVEKHAQNIPKENLFKIQKLRSDLEKTGYVENKNTKREALYEYLATFSEYFEDLAELAPEAKKP